MSPLVIEDCRGAASVPGHYVLLVGIALVSFASLLLELALTRLFSVVLFYHYAFLAISLALLGLGAGGVFAHLARARVRCWSLRRLAASISILWCGATLVALEVILRVPVRLRLDGSNFGRLTVLYICAAIPFCLTGFLFSATFARHPEQVSRLYGADLSGGALACLATVPLLNHLGAPNTVLLSGAVMSLSSLVWAGDKRLRAAGGVVALCSGVLIAINSLYPLFD